MCVVFFFMLFYVVVVTSYVLFQTTVLLQMIYEWRIPVESSHLNKETRHEENGPSFLQITSLTEADLGKYVCSVRGPNQVVYRGYYWLLMDFRKLATIHSLYE